MPKMRRIACLLMGAVLIVCFQNCSDFSPLDELVYDQATLEAKEALDAKLLPALLSSSSIQRWYKQETPTYVDNLNLADQWSIAMAIDKSVSGKFISAQTSPDVEEGSLSVSGGKIQAQRRSTGGASFSEYLEADIPVDGDRFVVAASFGAKAGDIKLLVNGAVVKSALVKSGTATDFSYLLKTESLNAGAAQVYEYMIFGGDSQSTTEPSGGNLTAAELNVLSRSLAKKHSIPNVIFDVSVLDEDSSGGSDTPQFLAAKDVIENKCVHCHKTGQNYPFLNNLSQSKAVSNGWIVPGNAATSKLYTVILEGTMPKSPYSIDATEVQTIYTWIQSIQ